jgi:hypothetical protein
MCAASPQLQGAIPGDLSPAPAAAVAAVLAAAAATTYIPAYLNNGGSTDVPRIAAGFGDALKTTFKAGRGWTGVFYSLSFWESLILGVALVAGPILPTVVSRCAVPWCCVPGAVCGMWAPACCWGTQKRDRERLMRRGPTSVAL